MSEIETDSSEMWRLVGAALLLAIVCAAAALMALRADAQPPAGQSPQAAIAAPAAASMSDAAPAVPAPAVSAPPAPPASPAAPPGSADSIPDDPTVAPDPRQKADDNVSFPVDI